MTLTKEWLQQTIAELEEERDAVPGAVNEDAAMALAAMKLALASLEAEAVGEVVLGEYDDCGCHPDARVACIAADGQADWENFKDGTRLYTAPPAPVSVPAAMEMDDDFDSAFEHGKAVGWNACRAAILQRAEPVQGWIPCSDRMPTKNHRVLIFINFNSDTVPPSIHDALFTGSTFRRGNATVNVFPLEDGYGVTHWMPLPAAPQLEVK